jgi:hypothetical protein
MVKHAAKLAESCAESERLREDFSEKGKVLELQVHWMLDPDGGGRRPGTNLCYS